MVEEIINKAIRQQINKVYDLIIKPEDNLYDDLGCDSLDVMEIIMATENLLKVQTSDKEIWKVMTVKDLYNLFEKYC